MKRTLHTFSFLLFITTFSIGQVTTWRKDGNAFLQFESKQIVSFTLPNFTPTLIADSSMLTPEGRKNALRILWLKLSEDESKLLFFVNSKRVWRYDTRGDYWVLDLKTKQLRQLGKGLPEASLMFAKFSPDGQKVAYVSRHNVYVETLAGHKIEQITRDGTDKIINGTFDWAYEEELDCRDGFRWSPDSKKIAYWQIDASAVKYFLMINNTDSIYPFTIPVEYPKVGEAPSAARIGIISLEKDLNTEGSPSELKIKNSELKGANTEGSDELKIKNSELKGANTEGSASELKIKNSELKGANTEGSAS